MPRSMLSRAATMTAGIALGLGLGLAPAQAALTPIPVPNPTVDAARDLDEFEVQVMSQINAVRAAAGLGEIREFDSCVDRMAEGWAERIAATGVFAHRNQRQVIRRCKQSWAGENLVRGELLTPLSTVQAWMASPSHREILLKRRATRAGVAIAVDAQGRYVGVLNVSDAP